MHLLYIVCAFNICAVTTAGLGRDRKMPLSRFMSSARDTCLLGITVFYPLVRQSIGVTKRKGARVYLVSS